MNKSRISLTILKAESMLKLCAELSIKHISAQAPHISISAGVSFYEKEDSLKSLIEKADVALLQSKAEGKNRVTFSR